MARDSCRGTCRDIWLEARHTSGYTRKPRRRRPGGSRPWPELRAAGKKNRCRSTAGLPPHRSGAGLPPCVMVREGARPTTQGNRVNATEAGLSPCVITGRASTRVRVGPVTRDFAWIGAKSRGWRGLTLTRVLARPAMTQGESIHPIALTHDVSCIGITNRGWYALAHHDAGRSAGRLGGFGYSLAGSRSETIAPARCAYTGQVAVPHERQISAGGGAQANRFGDSRNEAV
jgi:hypothetical protein